MKSLLQTFPVLNWREIAAWVSVLRPEVEGCFVDRAYVPSRPRFPDGFIKGEWALRLSSRTSVLGFAFSARSQHPYIAIYPERELGIAAKATQSVFGMALAKYLPGLRVDSIKAIDRERIVVLTFESKLRLILNLMPSKPEAFLADANGVILSRSRANAETAATSGALYEFPSSRTAPEMEIHCDALGSPTMFRAAIEGALDAEAFELRSKEISKRVKELLRECEKRARESEVAVRESEKEPDWQKWGDLLKAAMGTLPPSAPASRKWVVQDYESGSTLELPADPKLSLREQVQKFYQNAKRKTRRIEEARARHSQFEEKREKVARVSGVEISDWAAMERVEAELGIGAAERGAPQLNKKAGYWLGKTFYSAEGLAILVARTRTENLELTFKHARGNDMWLHVRGKPGAHVVVQLHSGKSPSLETLLDAANLCVYFSDGQNWGKTEVDYALKKYVKRIKDSTEASYTNNKTLIIEPDLGRVKKLTSQSS